MTNADLAGDRAADTLALLMAKSGVPASRQLARLERAHHILQRVHDELRALPASARQARLLKANRDAVEKLQVLSEKARGPIGTGATPAKARS